MSLWKLFIALLIEVALLLRESSSLVVRPALSPVRNRFTHPHPSLSFQQTRHEQFLPQLMKKPVEHSITALFGNRAIPEVPEGFTMDDWVEEIFPFRQPKIRDKTKPPHKHMFPSKYLTPRKYKTNTKWRKEREIKRQARRDAIRAEKGLPPIVPITTPIEGQAPNGTFFNTKSLYHAVTMWYNNRNKALKIFGHISDWDVSRISDMSQLFQGLTLFNDDISQWNTSNCVSMKGMFAHCHTFNQPLNGWDVSRVKNMDFMFYNTTSFNQPLSIWNTSSVLTMSSMFEHAKSFNKPIDKWDVSNVKDMSKMFEETIVFNQPLNSWYVGNVVNMKRMFYGSQAFNQSLSQWDVSNVITMQGMFAYTLSFNQPSLDRWIISNVQDLSCMFQFAKQFNYPLLNWYNNFINVRTTSNMFMGAMNYLQPADYIATWFENAPNLIDASGMFDFTPRLRKYMHEKTPNGYSYQDSYNYVKRKYDKLCGDWSWTNRKKGKRGQSQSQK